MDTVSRHPPHGKLTTPNTLSVFLAQGRKISPVHQVADEVVPDDNRWFDNLKATIGVCVRKTNRCKLQIETLDANVYPDS